MRNIALCFVLGAAIFQAAVAQFTCHDCEMDDDPSHCVINITQPMKCTQKYCTIHWRRSRPNNTITAFYRKCETTSIYMNTIIKAETEDIYYYACDFKECNSIQGADENVTNPHYIYITPGETSNSSSLSAEPARILLFAIFTAILLSIKERF